MDPEQILHSAESFSTVVEPPAPQWHFDAEPSNIISLAERGLLVPDPAEKMPDDFTYENYSPLNEW
jgi:hypothetical protein